MTKQQRDLGNNPCYGFRCRGLIAAGTHLYMYTVASVGSRAREPALRYYDSEIIDAILISIFILPSARSFIEINARACARATRYLPSAKETTAEPSISAARAIPLRRSRSFVTHLRKSRRHRASYTVTPEKSQAIAIPPTEEVCVNPRNVRTFARVPWPGFVGIARRRARA